MADEYIERTVVKNIEYNDKSAIDRNKRRDDYRNMLFNVSTMLKNEGPVISTWIKFQIGKSEPIIFDSSSTNPKKNLIANLSFNKCGAGVTNDFKITIQYDPFNMGQQQADIIEQLDEYVAKAMSYDMNTKDSQLRGKLMYGYNAVSDASLVSPEYEFYITNASQEVKFDSGLSSYIFEGCSVLGVDCDNVTTFPARKGWKLMSIIEWTLFYWYGTKEHIPAHTRETDEPTDNIYKYKIEIDDEVFNNAPQSVDVPEMTAMTPLLYCQHLLEEYPLTIAEEESGKYNNLAALSYAQRPRYMISVDDASKSIVVTHVAPAVTTDENGNPTDYAEKQLIELEDFPFYWGRQSTNLVIGWKPEINTQLYLIRRALALRRQAYITDSFTVLEAGVNLLKNNPISSAILDFLNRGTNAAVNTVVSEVTQQESNIDVGKGLQSFYEGVKQQLIDISDDVTEMYNAQLQLVGIPADPPISMAIKVIPTVLETVSRTAGVYIITGAKDEINSNGTYISTLNLLRIRGLKDPVKEIALGEEQTAQPSKNAVYGPETFEDWLQRTKNSGNTNIFPQL